MFHAYFYLLFRMKKNKKRIDFSQSDIPTKANRILYFILIGMLLILIRVWHLSVIEYDEKLAASKKPQQKTIIEPAVRATIRDRFNQPLALNKISYQATILYSQLRDIPSFTWQKDSSGKREKIFKRRDYIRKLSGLLGNELQLDPERIEDLIHSKAIYYSQVPFVIKEDLSEREYYRLKVLEKDWPGLHVRHLPRRCYPKGRVAADVIGYMGAINRSEYERILHEIKALEQYIQNEERGEENEALPGIENIYQAQNRLKELELKAYTIHDYVGKTGIEGMYEKLLRGFYGKKNFCTDSKGHYIRDLPGSHSPLPGHRILLSISSELQEYAEQLLAQNEELRIVRKSNLGATKQTVIAQKQPWIKGGAIVVMDPSNGEILTLASYPRFDPNDFILSGDNSQQNEKKGRIHRWFENEVYLAELWNQQQPLCRERYDQRKKNFYDQERFLSWNAYLDFILPNEGKLRQTMGRVKTIAQAIEIQKSIATLCSLFPNDNLYLILNHLYTGDFHQLHGTIPKGYDKQKILEILTEKQETIQKIKKQLDPYFYDLPQNYDKVLLADLCRLSVEENRFSPTLLQKTGKETLDNFHDHMGSLITLLGRSKGEAKKLFHEIDFEKWKEREQKEFLKAKRLEEKNAGIYPKPYLDYLDQKENALFRQFWNAHRWDCMYALLKGKQDSILSTSHFVEDLSPYLAHFIHEHEILEKETREKSQLNIAYARLRDATKGLSTELIIEYLKTLRPFDELTRPLLGKYRLNRKGELLEKHLATAFYPVYGHGYGRSHAYRQSTIQGSLFKLITAYEALVQRFQKLGRKVISPQDLNPLVIIDEVYQHGNTRYVGYTEDGKPIPQLYKGGRLPRSLAHKNTGRVDLLRALEMSSNPYFSLLAGECLDSPNDLSKAAELFAFGSRSGIELPGEIPGKVPQDLATNRTGLYAMAIGQHSLVVTPIQTAVMLSAIANGGNILKPKLVKLTAGPQLHSEKNRFLSSTMQKKEEEIVIKMVPTQVRWEIFMPEVIRQILLRGLQAVTSRTHQESLSSLSHLYRQHPEAIRQFAELKDQLLGKTSTSESVENIDLDLLEGTNIYTHVWFGSIAFKDKQTKKNTTALLLKDEFGKPELIVVVYLRYGGYGKEAAPLAAQMVKKWREINKKYLPAHNSSSKVSSRPI